MEPATAEKLQLESCVRKVSVDRFFEAILPPLPSDISIADVRSSLVTSGELNSEGRWTAFSLDPSDDARSEGMAFEGLSRVFNAIVGVVRERHAKVEQIVTLVHNFPGPESSLASHHDSKARPDAYLLLDKTKRIRSGSLNDRQHSWYDIAVPFLVQKRCGEKERSDNEQKILWSLDRMTCNDPSRRFAFGVTIENTETRLWFTRRSAILVSDSFNFITDIDRTIHLFCSLAFAQDHQLGWDPAIERKLADHKIAYDFTFHWQPNPHAIYCTVSFPSRFERKTLNGIATRVFKPKDRHDEHDELGDQSTATRRCIVIKDSQRELTRMREDIIVKQIFSGLQRDPSEIKNKVKFYVTYKEGEDIEIQGSVDETLRLRVFHGRPLLGDYPWNDPAQADSEQNDSKPYRLVFWKDFTPLYEMRILHDFVRTLKDGLDALKPLHQAGWVHGDITPSTLMRWGNQGVVTDFDSMTLTERQ